MIKTLTRLGAMALVSVTLLAACQEEQPVNALHINARDIENLTYLAENLTKSSLTDDEQKKVIDLYSNLSYEEMEAFIDVRYQHSLRIKDVDQDQAAYLRDFRHKVNQKAYVLKQKAFHQLDYANSEEVLQSLKPVVSGETTANSSSPNGRTAAAACITDAYCMPWRPNGSVSGNPDANASWIKGIYLGERTLQCTETTYQDDCDYVFRFNYSKVYRAINWRARGVLFLLGENFASKLQDINPDKIDCGVYVQDLMLGKDRVTYLIGNPQRAAELLELGLVESIDTVWCYTGTWGTEKWFNYGSYRPDYDNWGRSNPSTGWHPCVCTLGGKTVR